MNDQQKSTENHSDQTAEMGELKSSHNIPEQIARPD
jgi:hypothetical protein